MGYDLEEKLKTIIASCGEIDVESISGEADLITEYGLSSINIIQIIVEIESVFGIVIDDENLFEDRFSTYQGLVDIIKDRLNES